MLVIPILNSPYPNFHRSEVISFQLNDILKQTVIAVRRINIKQLRVRDKREIVINAY